MRLPGICFARSPKARCSQLRLLNNGACQGVQYHVLINSGSQQRLKCTTLFSNSARLSARRRKHPFSITSTRSASTTSELSDDVKWENILADAFMYGIRDKDQLLFEADIGHPNDPGSRLTDTLPGRQHIELWLILLRAQALQNGHDGIKAIWKGLKTRGKLVKLHAGDSRVDAFWTIFLAAGSSDVEFLWKICREARRSKFDRPALFSEIVGAALEGDAPRPARDFALSLADLFRGQNDLVSIFLSASRSHNILALQAFCNIYQSLPQFSIYSQIIPHLWQQNRPTDAFFMHSFLLSKGDLPLRFELLEPFIHYLVLHDGDQKSFINTLRSAGASFEGQTRHFWAIQRSKIIGASPDSLNTLVPETSHAKPRKFSDKFVARAFATRSIPFEFAVNSLRMLGLMEIGPLTIREMTLSSPNLETLRGRFEHFRILNIDTGSSVFVRTIQNACEAGKWAIVQAMANSDMHHEAFEDRHLQRRLLASYYRAQDWVQMNRTLAVMNSGKFDEAAKEHAANLLLQARLMSEDYHGAISLMSDMRYHGQKLEDYIKPRVEFMLRQECQRVAVNAEADKLSLLIGLLQDVVASGIPVGITAWWSPLHALGRRGRFKALETLSIWLAEWYRPGGLHYEYLGKRLAPRSSNLNDLFSVWFQQMVISRCFRIVKGRKTVSPTNTVRWAPLLKRLRDQYGVQIEDQIVRWMYIRRLRMMFSVSPYPFRSIDNRRMRSRNHFPLWRYWQLYNLNWGVTTSHDGETQMEEVIRGLYAPGRQEKRYQLRRQRGLIFQDTVGAAEVRAAMLAKEKRRSEERKTVVDSTSSPSPSPVIYGIGRNF